MSDRSPPDGFRRPEVVRPAMFEFVDEGYTDYVPPASGRRPVDDSTIGLPELVAMLRRRIWLVLLCVALGGGLAFFLHSRQEPTYRATAVIAVQDPRSQMSPEVGGYDRWWYSGWIDPLRSTLEALNSGRVLGRIVDQEGLRLRPVLEEEVSPPSILEDVRVGEFALPDTLVLSFSASEVAVESRRLGEGVRGLYGQRLDVGEISFRVLQPPPVPRATFALVEREMAVAFLAGGLTSQPRPETNVVDVTFTASDPELAQRVVNRAVMVFQDHSSAQARGESQRRKAFLEEQLTLADITLRAAQTDLAEFRSQEQVVSSQAQGASEQSGLMSIEMRREELRADRRMYQSILGGLATAEPGQIGERLQAIVATPEVASNPVVSALHGQLMGLEAERETLTSGPWALSERNPDLARLNQRIATTRGQLEAAVRSHMDILDARLRAMDELRDRTARQVSGRPETLAEEERLLQDVESIRRTVDQLRDEFYRARMTEAIEEGSVHILDLAGLPGPSSRTSLPVMLALGLMLGGMAGTGGGFLVEILNSKVRRREDVESALRVGTVGVIPRITALKRKKRGGKKGKRKPGEAPLPVPVGNGRGLGFEVVTVHDIRSSQAEAFRTLRTNLLYGPGNQGIRSMVVGSAMAGEGKTVTAANLAVTMAQQGLQVVLADCDLRKPRVDELFGIHRKPGMTEVLMGKVPLEEALRPYEVVAGLSILPAGTLPPNPTELLGGARTRELLRVLRERFDMVILDTPPLAGGVDSAILGAATDGVIMVVRAGQTETEAVRQAARQLHTVGARVLGAVMNDPDGEVKRYDGYYYHYGYYGREKEKEK